MIVEAFSVANAGSIKLSTKCPHPPELCIINTSVVIIIKNKKNLLNLGFLYFWGDLFECHFDIVKSQETGAKPIKCFESLSNSIIFHVTRTLLSHKFRESIVVYSNRIGL